MSAYVSQMDDDYCDQNLRLDLVFIATKVFTHLFRLFAFLLIFSDFDEDCNRRVAGFHGFLPLIQFRIVVGLGLFQLSMGKRWGTTLDRMPICHRANTKRHRFTFMMNLDSPLNLTSISLVAGLRFMDLKALVRTGSGPRSNRSLCTNEGCENWEKWGGGSGIKIRTNRLQCRNDQGNQGNGTSQCICREKPGMYRENMQT